MNGGKMSNVNVMVLLYVLFFSVLTAIYLFQKKSEILLWFQKDRESCLLRLEIQKNAGFPSLTDKRERENEERRKEIQRETFQAMYHPMMEKLARLGAKKYEY